VAADLIKISPEGFRTIFLRKEDRVILRTEAGRRIAAARIIPEEWTPYRVYEYEKALNDNKREIFLVDRAYLSQIEKEFAESIRND
jgi:hypothetical protein